MHAQPGFTEPMEPAMSALAARYRRYPRPAFTSTFAPAIPRALPSPAQIDAVLRLADRREAVGRCRVRLSLSDLDKVDAPTRRLLGQALSRLTEISILWDERESQIVRVTQAPVVRPRLEDEEDALWREQPRVRRAG
jgi:hypothetical protein